MKTFIKPLLATSLLIGTIFTGGASAGVIDAWKLDLSVLNGQLLSNGDVITGASTASNVDHVEVTGQSTITQQVVGGVAIGQSFTESGYLETFSYVRETNTTLGLDFGDNGLLGSSQRDLYGYIQFSGLTGTLNPDGSITFDPLSGLISYYIEEVTALGEKTYNPGSGEAFLKIAEFNILAPSGGSNLDFFGGTAANATIDITAKLINPLVAGLFKDSSGNDISTIAFHLINTDSLLNSNFDPNPDNTGVDGSGNGFSLIHVQNAGQYNLSTAVPEPSSIALLGLGLVVLGVVKKRRNTNMLVSI